MCQLHPQTLRRSVKGRWQANTSYEGGPAERDGGEKFKSQVRYPENTDAGDPANFGGIWDAGWC